jgi:hypothetical protein
MAMDVPMEALHAPTPSPLNNTKFPLEILKNNLELIELSRIKS